MLTLCALRGAGREHSDRGDRAYTQTIIKRTRREVTERTHRVIEHKGVHSVTVIEAYLQMMIERTCSRCSGALKDELGDGGEAYLGVHLEAVD